MSKADPELRFKCLELAMRSSTYKVESALETAKRFVTFVEEAEAPSPKATKNTGQPAKAPKTAGKTAAEDSSKS